MWIYFAEEKDSHKCEIVYNNNDNNNNNNSLV